MERETMASAMARAKLSEENRAEEEKEEAGETSFRVLYYGATEAAVPFMWESQPGTPKHPIFTKNDNMAPPLTPPPSYTSSPSPSPALATPSRKIQKPGFFSSIFSQFSRKKSRHVMTPTSLSVSYSGRLSWSISSSSSSPMSSPRRSTSRGKRQSRLFYDEEGQEDVGSPPNPIMCFGYNKQGCYPLLHVKNSIVSIKGQ